MSYPIIEIKDLSDLDIKIAGLGAVGPGHQRLYRGQNNDYSRKMLPSLYRSDQAYTHVDYSWKLAGQKIVKEEILQLEQRNIAEINDPSVIFPMDGMIQHYGLRSAGLDVTDDMHVALWFAQSKRIEERTIDHVMLEDNKKIEMFIFRKAYYEPLNAEFSYLYIFECPLWEKGNSPKNGDCVSLYQWYGQYTSRPAKQHAWYIYADNVKVPRGDLQPFVKCAFKIPRSLRNELGPYRETSFYFPRPAEDRFYTRLLGSYFMKNENNLFERMLDIPQYYNNREEVFRNDDPWGYIPTLR
ncbi:MAG TPA: FRG domain-containing protein, partial [Ferruginibacter sp.]|nr:FRG domain-containing protein [Ferruginibacter sp.]